jgi:hypothetical protein
MSYRQLLLFFIFPFLSGPLVAADVIINANGLEGKWVKGDKNNCDSNAAEYVTFRGNSVMEAGRGAEPRLVGFWSIRENVVTLHTLVAPNKDDTSNPFYSRGYGYSYLTAEVIKATDEVIEIITGTTGNTKKQIMAKCT